MPPQLWVIPDDRNDLTWSDVNWKTLHRSDDFIKGLSSSGQLYTIPKFQGITTDNFEAHCSDDDRFKWQKLLSDMDTPYTIPTWPAGEYLVPYRQASNVTQAPLPQATSVEAGPSVPITPNSAVSEQLPGPSESASRSAQSASTTNSSGDSLEDDDEPLRPKRKRPQRNQSSHHAEFSDSDQPLLKHRVPPSSNRVQRSEGFTWACSTKSKSKRRLLSPDGYQRLKPIDEEPMTNSQRRFCSNVLNTIENSKSCEFFRDPVDVEKEGVPDYYEYVENPMDLSKMKQRLQRGKYTSVDGFLSDMDQIVLNSLEYNGADNPVTNAGLEMRLTFWNLMKGCPKRTGSSKYGSCTGTGIYSLTDWIGWRDIDY